MPHAECENPFPYNWRNASLARTALSYHRTSSVCKQASHLDSSSTFGKVSESMMCPRSSISWQNMGLINRHNASGESRRLGRDMNRALQKSCTPLFQRTTRSEFCSPNGFGTVCCAFGSAIHLPSTTRPFPWPPRGSVRSIPHLPLPRRASSTAFQPLKLPAMQTLRADGCITSTCTGFVCVLLLSFLIGMNGSSVGPLLDFEFCRRTAGLRTETVFLSVAILICCLVFMFVVFQGFHCSFAAARAAVDDNLPPLSDLSMRFVRL